MILKVKFLEISKFKIDPISLQKSVVNVTEFFNGFYLRIDDLIEQKKDMEAEYKDSYNDY